MKLIGLLFLLSLNISQSSALEGHLFTKLSEKESWVETIRRPDKLNPDAILFAVSGGSFAYLMSSEGKVLNKWKFPAHISNVKFDNEGNLLALYRDTSLSDRGAAGAVRLISKEGKILWEYKNPEMHHGVSPTIHKTALVIVHNSLLRLRNKKKKQEFFKDRKWSCDSILEVNRKNEVVWAVHLAKLLQVSDLDKMKDRLSQKEYDGMQDCHTNSVREYETTPFSNEPAILVSMRNLDLVMLIEKKSKRILWKNKANTTKNQHDARLSGEWVYLFNNGLHNKEINSQALRINVLTNKREVLFEKNSAMYMPWGSPTKSGILPLSNGNILVVLGDPGQIWELTPEGDLVRKIYVLSSRILFELGATLFTVETYDHSFLKSVGIIQ